MTPVSLFSLRVRFVDVTSSVDRTASSKRTGRLRVPCQRQCSRVWGASTCCAGIRRGVGEGEESEGGRSKEPRGQPTL